jgi:hypothetical protein
MAKAIQRAERRRQHTEAKAQAALDHLRALERDTVRIIRELEETLADAKRGRTRPAAARSDRTRLN